MTTHNIHKIILGTWALGGHNNIEGMALGWKQLDEIQIQEVLNEAYSCGIRVYDTSDFYGQGSVEKILGKLFKERRDEVILATKGGIKPSFTNQYGQLKKDFSSGYIEQALNRSLINLSTNHIDLYQLHGAPSHIFDNKDLLSFFTKLKDSNKIQSFGISLGSTNILEDLERFSKYDLIDSIQIPYSLTNPKLISSINNWCKQSNRLKILGRSIFHHGIFAMKTPSIIQDRFDHRSRKYNHELIDNVIKFQQLLESELHMSLLEASLYYAIKSKSVNKIILGATSKEQIKEWIGVLERFENNDDYSEHILKLAFDCFH